MLCLLLKSRPDGNLWVVLYSLVASLRFIDSLIGYLKESKVCPDSVSLCSAHASQMFFMLFSWLSTMRHKQCKVSALHHLHCWCSPANWSFKLCVLDLIRVKISATKGQVFQSCDMEPGGGWNSQADLWIKKCNSERLPQKPISEKLNLRQ